MLQKLIVNNYAIIDHLVIEPDAHLNTVTGETGAGKSIILGALSLILGDRADTSVLINKEEKCVVEAHFDVRDNAAFANALANADIDKDDICIIRREINTSGKSRAFVNDTPVTLNVLNSLTSLLVDLHQQFDHLALEDDNFQLDVLDASCRNSEIKRDYLKLFTDYKNKCAELEKLRSQQTQWQKEADYKQFLFDELLQAAYKQDEIEQADQQLKQLASAEKIIQALDNSHIVLEGGEEPLTNELKRINQQLQSIADVMPDVAPLSERLLSAWAELKDIAAELEHLRDKVSIDDELVNQLQERIDLGYKLYKKHGVNTTNDLLDLQQKLEEELKATLDLNDRITESELEVENIHKQLMQLAEAISEKRRSVIPTIEDKVNELLVLVGMPNARFKIDQKRRQELAKTGIDSVNFLLDANKSGQFLPVHKVASGGEMSRIMLCIKSITAKAMEMPTLIFDEVDTGISGEAARQVGLLLQDLAKFHQVVCITHQPQVASKGARHFYVYKSEDKQRITTKIKVLQKDERVLAIARMIGGEQPSEAALQNARELVLA